MTPKPQNQFPWLGKIASTDVSLDLSILTDYTYWDGPDMKAISVTKNQ